MIDETAIPEAIDVGEDSALRREIIERYRVSKKFYDAWDEVAKEDYRFALGDQWTEDERTTLTNASRPVLTFNHIRPLINLISGYQRENSARIKVNPEGGEDAVFSEVMDRAIKAIDKWSHFTHKSGYWFDEGCYCGKSILEAIMSYEEDPIRGELQFKQASPYQVRIDPDCNEYDLNTGARYLFKTVRLSKEDLIDLYPNKKTLINSFKKDNDSQLDNGDGFEGPIQKTDDDYGNSDSRSTTKMSGNSGDESTLDKDGKFTVKEYWHKKMVTKYFVINLIDSLPERFDTKEQANTFIDQQKFGKIIERQVREMWTAAYCCGFVLQNEKSSFEPYYSGFPFFRFLADWAPNAPDEILRVQGITRPLKDPQREKNKSKSQYLHILNTQSNSGWIGDEDALTNNAWKDLEDIGSKPGITIKKRKGSELREILPKGPNQGHLMREEQADAEFKAISGINADLLAMQEGGTDSGRAISLRIKQAILSLVRLFANYRYSKEIVGKFMLDMMPLLFDSKKLMKVIGQDFMQKLSDPQKYPQGLNEGHVQAFLQMVQDNRYDVLVTEADQNSTIRFEIFQELSDLMQKGAPIPVDLLIDYMDLPNTEEVKKRVLEQQQILAQQAAATGKPAGQR